MGQIILGYVIFMAEVFILLTSVTSVETAVWTFGIVYAGCVLGTLLCVWWEGERRVLTRERSR